MASHKVKDLEFYFDILEDGKSAKIYRITYPLNTTEIRIPETVQYNGRNYTITEISQYEYREEKKERVTDKRKKNYGKYIGTGEYEYYVGSCLTECEYSSLRGDYIYSNNFAIECVVIPDTVKVISSNAFWACVKLKNINIPEGVEVLGRSAFGSCEKLQEITLPSTIKRIEKNCFRNTNTVVTIKNEEGVVDIGEGAFGPGNSVEYVGKPEKNETPQPEQSATAVPPVTIDLDKLIEAVIADGVITDKEKSVIIKKATAAGYDADEVEILLDGKLAEKLSQSVPNTPVVEETKPVAKPEEKTSVIQEEKPATDTVKSEVAKKETSTKSKSKQSSVSYEDYVVTINEDKSISVTLKGELCDNTKKALREIAELVGFEYDNEWTTRQFGSKLIDFLEEKK